MVTRTDRIEPASAKDAAAGHFKGKAALRRIVQALSNAPASLTDAWRGESPFRQQALLAGVLISAACLVHVSRLEPAILIASVLQSPIVELLKSSIKAAIDRISLEQHQLSRRAKDLGSASVSVAFVLLAIVWSLVLVHR
jgi:diacylglycerol kinase (ATP)